MSAHTGASALLSLLTQPLTGPSATASDAERLAIASARRALRDALRRRLRAHCGLIGPAAASLGVSKAALHAGAAAIDLKLEGKPGRPGRTGARSRKGGD